MLKCISLTLQTKSFLILKQLKFITEAAHFQQFRALAALRGQAFSFLTHMVAYSTLLFSLGHLTYSSGLHNS